MMFPIKQESIHQKSEQKKKKYFNVYKQEAVVTSDSPE